MFALAAFLERFCAVFGTCSMGITERIPVTPEFLAEKNHLFSRAGNRLSAFDAV
jgi:hypothetical protein